jgi:hypothetical protein
MRQSCPNVVQVAHFSLANLLFWVHREISVAPHNNRSSSNLGPCRVLPSVFLINLKFYTSLKLHYHAQYSRNIEDELYYHAGLAQMYRILLTTTVYPASREPLITVSRDRLLTGKARVLSNVFPRSYC